MEDRRSFFVSKNTMAVLPYLLEISNLLTSMDDLLPASYRKGTMVGSNVESLKPRMIYVILESKPFDGSTISAHVFMTTGSGYCLAKNDYG